MFTGIIEEVGRIQEIFKKGGNLRLRIEASRVLNSLKVGDSMNIDGACQTIIGTDRHSFEVEAVEETLTRTNLGRLKKSDLVNLERSLKLSDRLGGHLVSGHVDWVGRIKSIVKKDESSLYEFELPEEHLPYLVQKGSVAVDGISLTVVKVKETSFTVSIIPFTLENTTLNAKRVGDLVNIETDLIGKYVERMVISKKHKSQISEEWLKERGW